MRIWTFQPKEIQQQLEQGKTYVCDPSKSFLLNEESWLSIFAPAYSYMIEQMEKRINLPNDSENIPQSHSSNQTVFPIWCWFKEDGLNKKPDLRKHSYVDSSLVLIEAEISNDKILLSDFEKWHNVLNNCEIFDDEYYDSEEDLPELTQKEIVETWSKIFEIDESQHIQGCFWELKPEEVVKYYPINRKIK